MRLLDDDIASRIRVVKNKYNSSEQRYLSFEGKKEITSRIPSWEIAQVLEKLAISYDKKKEKQGVYVRLYVNDTEKQKEVLDRLMSYRSRFLQIYEYQKQEDDKMAALHAKLIVSDVKKSLVSSANLSYHGMQGNIEMGFLIESHDKAKQIEEVMKEMVRMKVFVKYK